MKTHSKKANIVNLLPFLKWAGGKRWFVSKYMSLFPSSYNRYIEPFLGSAAVYFHLQPQSAILSDINKDLIETYIAIKDDWENVYNLLKQHHRKHGKEYYYKIRSSKPRTISSRAARIIYLNRTCWNGLYRVNVKGEFNVPIGSRSNVTLDTDNFANIANLLKNTKLLQSDFEEVINQAQQHDLLFVDPPYTVKHTNNGFIKYNENLFHWDDQVRLSQCLIRAIERGAHIIHTNADYSSIRNLYENHFNIMSVKRNSTLAATSYHRGQCKELIIRS